MCFKAPKPPAVVADPELAREKADAEANAQATRAANKDSRTETALATMMGRTGRASLFSGGAGGAGFAAPQARSLFTVNG